MSSRRRLPPSAEGTFTPGWGTCKVSRDARKWRDGWDAERDRCPPDPKDRCSPHRRGWREAGLASGKRWRKLGLSVRNVIRALRFAGYVARNRWARVLVGKRRVGLHLVDDWRYLEGPAEGRQAVDPWHAAEELLRCSADWYVQARLKRDGNLTALAVPRPCNQRHVCPRCAARRSNALAAAARSVLGELQRQAPAPLALLTLTQRDHARETLDQAIARWRAGWDYMTKGRRGERFKRLVSGFYYGLEVTRGEDGKKQIEIRDESGRVVGRRRVVAQGKWWHVHAHVIVRLNPAAVAALGEARIRAELGAAWRDASGAAAAERGLEGYGWDPEAASGCRGERWDRCAADRDPARWEGKWWKPIDPDNPKEVYQACKYPTPIGSLHPVQLAEFLSAAHGRRWHQGGGELRSIVKDAEELEERNLAELEDVDELEEPLDLGTCVHVCAPNAAPNLDEVAPEHGWKGAEISEPPAWEFCRWRLAREVDLEALSRAADALGGWVAESQVVSVGEDGAEFVTVAWDLFLPSEWTARELRATSRAIGAARERAERARSRLPRERREAEREARELTARVDDERALANEGRREVPRAARERVHTRSRDE